MSTTEALRPADDDKIDIDAIRASLEQQAADRRNVLNNPDQSQPVDGAVESVDALAVSSAQTAEAPALPDSEADDNFDFSNEGGPKIDEDFLKNLRNVLEGKNKKQHNAAEEGADPDQPASAGSNEAAPKYTTRDIDELADLLNDSVRKNKEEVTPQDETDTEADAEEADEAGEDDDTANTGNETDTDDVDDDDQSGETDTDTEEDADDEEDEDSDDDTVAVTGGRHRSKEKRSFRERGARIALRSARLLDRLAAKLNGTEPSERPVGAKHRKETIGRGRKIVRGAGKAMRAAGRNTAKGFEHTKKTPEYVIRAAVATKAGTILMAKTFGSELKQSLDDALFYHRVNKIDRLNAKLDKATEKHNAAVVDDDDEQQAA